MKVKIENNGQSGYATKITNAETGEIIKGVSDVEIAFEASGRYPMARLVVHFPVIDVIVDADIKHVCPVCGSPVDDEPGQTTEENAHLL